MAIITEIIENKCINERYPLLKAIIWPPLRGN